MSEEAQRFLLYRCTVHGGSKDWAIAITESCDLQTLHCATGQPVRLTHIPRSTFNNAGVEESRLILEKEKDGYVYAGMAIVESNRLNLTPAGSTTATVNANHWEIIQPLDRKQVHEKLAWAAGQLHAHVSPDTLEYDPDSVLLRCTGRPQEWVFGFSDAGGIQDSGRGGGQILRRHGLLPRLLIVYLMRCFPDAIHLSDGADGIRRPQIVRDDEFLGERACDYDRVLALGERLGLCLGRISLLESDAGSSHRAIWI